MWRMSGLKRNPETMVLQKSAWKSSLKTMPCELLNATVNVTIQDKNFTAQSVTVSAQKTLRPGLNRVTLQARVSEARLWWPWDLGEQNLYEAVIQVQADAQPSDLYRQTFGIRTVRLEFNPGFSREEVEHPWRVVFNGRPYYLRSAAWGGPPSILYGRTSLEHYRHLIREARAPNINNLRIFGWHPPEIKEFYELCDEAGITVWQVFPFGNAVFPKDREFLSLTLAEIEAIVRERRNHPSLVLWQGGKEVIHVVEHFEGANLSLMS